ncbi:MAG: hypothetical protein JSV89_19795 [Spirochaetaceae bacterium]|nr:MAG: hypothetical protein JSV89_19795 [Spirochaetaceae bacterium]
MQGYRNVTALVESSLALINTFHPSPGTAVHITSGLGAADFDEIALKLSINGGTYAYLLEVWTRRSGIWAKAMEYAYDDANAGQIVFSPHAFDSTYSSGSLHKIEFNHSLSNREMTVYSQHSPAVSSVTASIGLAQEEGGHVDLYFTAKQGLRDQGDPYDFTLFGAANPANNGHFDQNGFDADGQIDDGSYPAESEVDPANLPTSAEVNGAGVSFQSIADPDFI